MFKGKSVMALTLTRLDVNGTQYRIDTSNLARTKKGKGRRSAAFIGGGAGMGMLIGGVATGGVGLLVGGLAGGGAGALGAAFTGNRDLSIPAESVVTFRLQDALTLAPETQVSLAQVSKRIDISCASHGGSMVLLLCAFLMGCVCGLRSMTAPAVVAWGAHLGWLHLQARCSPSSHKISLVIFSLFAVGELIADKLPFIPADPSRATRVRVIFGAMWGSLVYFRRRIADVGAAGRVGGVAGAFAGYTTAAGWQHGPRSVLALLEDLVASAAVFLVSR